MEIRRVLAGNLKRLEAAAEALGKPELATVLGVEAATDGRVSKTTLYAVRAERQDMRLTNIAEVAHLYGFLPWMLLVPDFDPLRPPHAVTDAEIEAEVQRRFVAIAQQQAALQVTDEEARSGPSVAYPFGPVQDARPEPLPKARRLGVTEAAQEVAKRRPAEKPKAKKQ